jgi:hypothetical protein
MARPLGPWLSLDEISDLPRVVLTTPWAPSDIPLVGLVATSATASHAVWHFHALTEASADQLATLTSLILLHEEEPILPFSLMPSRPPTGYLLKSGVIRRGRGFFLAPWAEQEVKRLTLRLTTDHADYLHLLSDALHQRDESPRVYRRPQRLRDWGHEQTEAVFSRSPGASGPNGPRARA